jgi:hypothetical protein
MISLIFNTFSTNRPWSIVCWHSFNLPENDRTGLRLHCEFAHRAWAEASENCLPNATASDEYLDGNSPQEDYRRKLSAGAGTIRYPWKNRSMVRPPEKSLDAATSR